MSRFVSRFNAGADAALYKENRTRVTPSRRAPRHVAGRMTRRAANRDVFRRRSSLRIL